MTDGDDKALRWVVATLLSDAERAAAGGEVFQALSQLLSAASVEQISEEPDGREFARHSHTILTHLLGRLQAHFGKSEWQLDDPPAGTPDLNDPRCSFCAKKQSDVAKLVAGYGVWICDECIRLCGEVVE